MIRFEVKSIVLGVDKMNGEYVNDVNTPNTLGERGNIVKGGLSKITKNYKILYCNFQCRYYECRLC